MQQRLPPQLEIPVEIAVFLGEAAIKAVRAALPPTPRKRFRKGRTLRPGVDTPLWNTLAGALQTQFRRRGEKVRLARVLGLPRQRVTEMLRTRKHLPDAERTLLLLLWLHARRHGRDLA